MKKLNCKVITPLFMHGADGRTPELRVPSIRGLMRFWWRSINAFGNSEALKKEEAKIFGAAGEHSQPSSVIIRICHSLGETDISFFQLFPHHKSKNCRICKSQDCSKSLVKLKAIKPGTEFQIEYFVTESNFATIVEPLIWLTFTLGGFGKRSRRGFGSIRLVDKSPINLESIVEKLNSVKNSYEIDKSRIVSDAYAILNKSNGGNYPWIKEVIVSKRKFEREVQFTEFIGKLSHEFCDPSLGCENPRMASPVYVSCFNSEDKIIPVVTVFNACYPKEYRKTNNKKLQEFVKKIISP